MPNLTGTVVALHAVNAVIRNGTGGNPAGVVLDADAFAAVATQT